MLIVFEKKIIQNVLHIIILGNSDYQATNTIKKTPRPSVRVRVEHFIENIHVNQSSSYIQLFISTFYYCCMESIPLLFAYKLYRNSQIRQSYPSSSFGLGLILLIGREFPYDVNELLTKRRKVVLFLFWLIVNMGIIIFYYYAYLHKLIFEMFWRIHMPFVATAVDLLWPFILIMVSRCSEYQSMNTISN